MTILGTFIKTGSPSEYVGELTSFTIRHESVRIVPVAHRGSDSAPTHRMMLDDLELAPGWTKTTEDGRDYIGFKFDDPSFVAPIYPGLFDRGDGRTFDLSWSRPKKRRAD